MDKSIGTGTRRFTAPLDPSLGSLKPSDGRTSSQDPRLQVVDAGKPTAADSWDAEEKRLEPKRAEGKHLAEQALEVRANLGRAVRARGTAGTGTSVGYQPQYTEAERNMVGATGVQLAAGRTDEGTARMTERQGRADLQRTAAADEFRPFDVRHDAHADQPYPSDVLEGPVVAPEAGPGGAPGKTAGPEIEGAAGRFRFTPVYGENKSAPEGEAPAATQPGSGPVGMPAEGPVAVPPLPDFGPGDPARPLTPGESKALAEGLGMAEAAVEDMVELLGETGTLPRGVGDKPLPAPQRAILKRLARFARQQNLGGSQAHAEALDTAATPRLTGFLKKNEAEALRKAIQAVVPALKGRIGRQQTVVKQLAGILAQAAPGPKDRAAALRALQGLRDGPLAARPAGFETTGPSLRPALPRVVADARKVVASQAAGGPSATGAPPRPDAARTAAEVAIETGHQAEKRERAQDRREARRLERLQQEERSEERFRQSRAERRRADRKRVSARIEKLLAARQAGRAALAARADSVAARRFRFLRDISERGRGDPRGRPGTHDDPQGRERPRLIAGPLRAAVPERLDELRRQARDRKWDLPPETDGGRPGEREHLERLETARRRSQEEEGRLVERRRLEAQEQAHLDSLRRHDRLEQEHVAQRKRAEREEAERDLQRRRHEREDHEEHYLQKRRQREDQERDEQRKREEERLRTRRSQAREQAARQAAGLTTHDGGISGGEAAEFGIQAPSQLKKEEDEGLSPTQGA